VVTLDYHANISAELFAAADVVIGYDTYPHTDMAARGSEAAQVLAEIMTTGAPPKKAFRKLPLITPVQKQANGDEPMRSIMARAAGIEGRSGIATVTVAPGFPFADVPQLGLAVLTYADTQAAADDAADELAGEIWKVRAAFRPNLVSVEAAVATAVAAKRPPFVLVDVADNVGGGAPGDGTAILAALLRIKAPSAAIVIWDPEAAAKAMAIGTGGEFRGAVGGKADATTDDPVAIAGRVVFAAPVSYVRESSYMTGQMVRLGPVAVVDVAGILIMLTTERAMPFDAAHLRAAGIEPEKVDVLVVKSAIAWAAGFGAMARGHLFVDAPGICSSNLTRFKYVRRPRPLYPLESDAVWHLPAREMAS
jgi:microcystin degradation protein MlrC